VELRLLQYFITVCEQLHFTKAAVKLGISQPTLSQQIQLLEHRVGTALFHRIGKKTYITDAGHILLKHSLQAFHELEQAQTAINELRGMQRGGLRIGCSGNHLLTATIRTFHTLYPKIELSVTELATEETREGLLNNRLDIGVVFLPLQDELLKSIPLYDEQLQLVVSTEHELAAKDSLKLADLQQLATIQLQEKFYVRQLLDDYCKEAGFLLKPIIELSTLESLLQTASCCVGGAIVPKSYAESIDRVKFHVIAIIDPIPQRKVGIVYRKETFMCKTIETFIQQLSDHFNRLNLNDPGT